MIIFVNAIWLRFAITPWNRWHFIFLSSRREHLLVWTLEGSSDCCFKVVCTNKPTSTWDPFRSCVNHPWPVEGGLTPFADHGWASPDSRCPLVAQMWMDLFWEYHPGFEHQGKRGQCFWCSNTLWCSPITLDLLWRALYALHGAVIFKQRERRVLLQAPCHHRASQSKWPPAVGAALRTGSFRGANVVYCGKVVLFLTNTLYGAEQAHSNFSALLVTHSQG